MGVDYTAYQIVGCRIPAEKLHRSETRPGCACGKAKARAKFCPECGNHATVTADVPIYGYEPGEDFGDLQSAASTDGEDVVFGLHVQEVGGWSSGDPNAVRLDPSVIAAAREEVERALAPVGLWDPAEFGVWTLLHCSY